MHQYVPELRRLSEARLKDDEKYQKHLKNVVGMKAISDREEVPLEYNARKAMMADDRELRELDDEDDEDEDSGSSSKKRRKRNERAKDDPVLDEAFKIMLDLVRLNDGREIPQPRGWWF